ncbi:aldo/keto reductase [Kribbella sandramycini]|uniref:Aryl-alcohol dehydrogenase-like predicted oxidoreductase n=1 Tax=Kribbella sandramycini TaxID=60450 RepID=A0A841SH20_9ACTN|nr:aryl-alcohol dehydrogenase-like predicted oxidoreductase [Kribbella sandramycini]
MELRRVGFGAKRLGGAAGELTVADGAALVRLAVELGVNHVDTALFYPSFARAGEAWEFEVLGWANEAVRAGVGSAAEVLVATKVGPTAEGMARPDQLAAYVEENLRTLGRDSLDLVYLWQAGLSSVAEHFGVLAELRDKGLIRQLGLSNIRNEHLAQAQEIAPVAAVQNRYGVGFGRVNDELLRVCGEQGIAFVPYFALTGASREAGGVASDDVIQRIADAHGATPAQIRLAWTLSLGSHVLVIPGTGNPRHLEQNLAAADIRLSPAEIETLSAIPAD